MVLSDIRGFKTNPPELSFNQTVTLKLFLHTCVNVSERPLRTICDGRCPSCSSFMFTSSLSHPPLYHSDQQQFLKRAAFPNDGTGFFLSGKAQPYNHLYSTPTTLTPIFSLRIHGGRQKHSCSPSHLPVGIQSTALSFFF